MKRNIFKFGAALTAAMMVFSATAALAFADEIEPAEETEAVVTDVAEAPEAEAVPTDAAEEEAEEVVIPLETEEITAEDVVEAEAEVEAAAKVDDGDTGSVITIGDITATVDDSYYTVNVPFTVENAPSQMSFFVYDITKITGNQNNEVGFKSETETPVGYINQYDGTTKGTYTFKLSTANYTNNSIIVAKIGGTEVAVPDAASYSLANATSGGGDDVVYGDVDNDGKWNASDVLLTLQFGANKTELSEKQQKAADVNVDGKFNADDSLLILQYGANKIDTLPQPVGE